MLHLVGAKTARDNLQLMALLDADAAIVWLDDASYTVLLPQFLQALTTDGAKNTKHFILRSHAEARGISSQLPETIKQIEYADLVQLTQQHATLQSWP